MKIMVYTLNYIFFEWAELNLTSIFCANFGLNNGDKCEVVDFIYKDKTGPRSVNIPEVFVVYFP